MGLQIFQNPHIKYRLLSHCTFLFSKINHIVYKLYYIKTDVLKNFGTILINV